MAWLALVTTGCQPFVLDADVVQSRHDKATPPLDGSHTLAQSFVCGRPNLCEVELLPAVYGAPGEGTLKWRLTSGADGREVAAQSIPSADISANAPLRLAFSAQPNSAGQAYTLHLEGGAGLGVGFWRSSFNAYDGGVLQVDGREDAGDLRFTTRCRYDPPTLIRQVGAVFLPQVGLLIPLGALLLLPGYLLRNRVGLGRMSDPVATLALTVALSLAVVPVALLWSTVAGLRWQPMAMRLAFGLLAAYALAHLWRTRGSDLALWLDTRDRPLVLAMAALLGTTMLLRLIQIRDLVLPAWVDSPLHVLVTQLVSLHGQVPRSYEPLLPIASFSYHFGFHTGAAVFAWLSGLAIPQAILILGQVLNALCIVSTYLLSVRLTGRRIGGVIAAAIVGLVSYLPAYYVSWGRYTQLTGMLMLPTTLMATLEWLEGARRDYRWLLGGGLMQAGLFLTHARVSIFGACFLLAYLLVAIASRSPGADRRRNAELWQRSGLLAGLALGLSAPWVVQVVGTFAATLRTAAGSLRGDPSYNAVPWQLLFIGRNRELMAIAAVGAATGLRQRRRETVWVLLWCLIVALVVNPGLVGLPSTNLLNNATAIIALFLPLAVLCGQGFAFVWDHGPWALWGLARMWGVRWPVARATRVALAMLLAIATLGSAWSMVSIVNPDTVLATAEDLAAMAWIRENTPSTAVFLINARHWQVGIYTGTDGGYWIPLLTGRRAILPAIAYSFGAPEYVGRVNEVATVVAQAPDVQDPGFRSLLMREQAGYVYVGARGGPLSPALFLEKPGYRAVYSSGGVWIFEIEW